MALPGVSFSFGTGGLGRVAPGEDGHAGLIISVPAGYAGGIVGQNWLFTSVTDAENESITATEDATHSALVWYHINEFFRMGGTRLYCRFVANTTTQAQMLDSAGANAPALLNFAEGKIRMLAVARNPVTPFAPTIANGLDQDVSTAVANAVLLIGQALLDGRPLVVLVEGKAWSGTVATTLDARTLNAKGVGIVLARDVAVGSTLPGHAAMGTALGTLSAARVHENIGWVQQFNIQASGHFAQAGFVNGAVETGFTNSQLDLLLEKGYLFTRSFTGYPGVFWASDPACITATADEAQLRYTRAVQKAVRGVRAVMLPLVNSPVYQTAQGTIAPGTIKSFERQAASPLEQMSSNGEISGYDVYIDPDQNILSTDTLNINIAIQPVGCASKIQVQISLTTQIAQ